MSTQYVLELLSRKCIKGHGYDIPMVMIRYRTDVVQNELLSTQVISHVHISF